MQLRSGRIIKSANVVKANSIGPITSPVIPSQISRREFSGRYIQETMARIKIADDQIEKVILHTELFNFIISNYNFIISYGFLKAELRNKFIRTTLNKCLEYKTVKLREPGNECEMILQNSFRTTNSRLAYLLQEYVDHL